MTDVIDNLIDEIERSYGELNEQLSDPELLADRSRYTAAARRHAELADAHALALQYREAEHAAADAEEMLAGGSGTSGASGAGGASSSGASGSGAGGAGGAGGSGTGGAGGASAGGAGSGGSGAPPAAPPPKASSTTRCAPTSSRSSTTAAGGRPSWPKRSACRCSRATPTTPKT